MYYPKSQISTNLYTKGNELQVQSTGENYVGYYYKTSTGAYYSGKNPSDKPTVTLVLNKNTKYFQSPLLEKDNNNKVLGNYPDLGKQASPIVSYNLDSNYAQISPIDYESKFIQAPVNNKITPTEKDYTRGQYQRYFLKKINNPIFKEQPKEIYERYAKKDQYVQYDLYIPFNFVWMITGENKTKVANINYSILELTEQRYNITGLINYFKNKLTEYYK